ncbi:hypothetical protein Pcac1_g29217 [Phytophthora cactorum]|nr:hypothetical protein Pcac1_g29217 [Phytophthora cactorum]
MMQDVAAFRHLHAEELALQVDASSLLRTTVQRLQEDRTEAKTRRQSP